MKKLLQFKRPLQCLLYIGFILGIFLTIIELGTLIIFASESNKGTYSYFEISLYCFGISYLFQLIFSIPFFIIYKLMVFGSKSFLLIMGILIIIINLGLNNYFITTHNSLGSDLFGYSINDLIMIVNSSSEVSIASIATLFAIPALFVYSLISPQIRRIPASIHTIVGIISLGFICFNLFKPITRFAYFIIDAREFKLTESLKNEEWASDNKYPLLKPLKLESDVLGENLNLNVKKPNIVILVIEGLGRDFMGDGAQYGGFTPYLDSLSKQSLYWSNFVSITGRSFGALPSILGSAPFGEQGFMEVEKIPDHLSLITLLKRDDYFTSYYEGGDSGFDNKVQYLQNEGIDIIVDQSNYSSKYKKASKDSKGFSWGYPDSEIFKRYLLENNKTNNPRLDVVLTISNHEPFIYPNQTGYKQKVDKIAKTKGLDYKKEILEKSKDILGALVYTDESIRDFMESYKARPDYNNTIFIITGDHRLIPIGLKDNICRFHVPLIVFSPMLKQPQEYKGISSHADIMPSIMAMLNNKYKSEIPAQLPWIGNGLSNSKTFSGNKEIPLMKYKGSFTDYIVNDMFYSDGNLYQLSDNLEVINSNDYSKLSDAKDKYNDFKKTNLYVMDKNMIVPPNMLITKIEGKEFTKEEQIRIDDLIKGEKDTEKIYFIARDLAFNKKHADAILLCDYVIQKKPRNFEAATLKGRIYSWSDRYDQSEKTLTTVLEKSPNCKDAYVALLNLYFWNDKYDKAQKLYQSAQVHLEGEKEIIDKLNIIMGKIKANNKNV